MARFRKKPLEVEASQWTGPWVKLAGVFEEAAGGDPATGAGALVRHYVVTAHGQRAYLAPGDWVITENNQVNHYPCRDEIFRATYDPVGDGDPRRAVELRADGEGWERPAV